MTCGTEPEYTWQWPKVTSLQRLRTETGQYNSNSYGEVKDCGKELWQRQEQRPQLLQRQDSIATTGTLKKSKEGKSGNRLDDEYQVTVGVVAAVGHDKSLPS